MDTDLVALAREAARDAVRPSRCDTGDLESDVSSTFMPRSSGQEGTSLPAAGWYPDPRDAVLRRWWDGGQWTGHVRPTSAPRAAPPIGPDTRRSIQGLAGDISGDAFSRFAPGGPQPVQQPRGRHASTTATTATVAMPVIPTAPSTPGTAIVPAASAPAARAIPAWQTLPVRNPAATASLVLGVLSILLPVILPSVFALVLGGIGLGRADRTVGAVGRAEAAWGIALAAIGIVVTAVLIGIAIANPSMLASLTGAPSS
jgi:hypothetical protein